MKMLNHRCFLVAAQRDPRDFSAVTLVTRKLRNLPGLKIREHELLEGSGVIGSRKKKGIRGFSTRNYTGLLTAYLIPLIHCQRFNGHSANVTSVPL